MCSKLERFLSFSHYFNGDPINLKPGRLALDGQRLVVNDLVHDLFKKMSEGKAPWFNGWDLGLF